MFDVTHVSAFQQARQLSTYHRQNQILNVHCVSKLQQHMNVFVKFQVLNFPPNFIPIATNTVFSEVFQRAPILKFMKEYLFCTNFAFADTIREKRYLRELCKADPTRHGATA